MTVCELHDPVHVCSTTLCVCVGQLFAYADLPTCIPLITKPIKRSNYLPARGIPTRTSIQWHFRPEMHNTKCSQIRVKSITKCNTIINTKPLIIFITILTGSKISCYHVSATSYHYYEVVRKTQSCN